MTVLDEEALADLERDLGADGVAMLLRTLLESTPAQIDAVTAAAAAGDAREAARAAHRIRSGALMVGARELGEACGALEEAGLAAGDLAGPGEAVAGAWDRTRAAILARPAGG